MSSRLTELRVQLAQGTAPLVVHDGWLSECLQYMDELVRTLQRSQRRTWTRLLFYLERINYRLLAKGFIFGYFIKGVVSAPSAAATCYNRIQRRVLTQLAPSLPPSPHPPTFFFLTRLGTEP